MNVGFQILVQVQTIHLDHLCLRSSGESTSQLWTPALIDLIWFDDILMRPQFRVRLYSQAFHIAIVPQRLQWLWLLQAKWRLSHPAKKIQEVHCFPTKMLFFLNDFCEFIPPPTSHHLNFWDTLNYFEAPVTQVHRESQVHNFPTQRTTQHHGQEMWHQDLSGLMEMSRWLKVFQLKPSLGMNLSKRVNVWVLKLYSMTSRKAPFD